MSEQEKLVDAREKLLEIEMRCIRVLTELKRGFDTIGTEMLAQEILNIINGEDKDKNGRN
jgi:hypothetical protein